MAADRLDDAGRAALHADCPHRPDGACPIEAAEAARYTTVEIVAEVAILVVLWIAVPVVGIAFSGWHTDTVSQQHAPVWPLFLAFATGMTVIFGADLPRLAQNRRESKAIAAAGPTCDPWPLARSWPGRHHRRPLPHPHWRPITVAVASLTAIAIWLAVGSVAGAVLAGGWCVVLGAWIDRVLRHRRDDAMAHHG
jgi:hypothetical protein